jgi:hypothetical protein
MSAHLMATPPTPLASAKRRALRRQRSGGGTMFVVAMTLAVLSTIGAWALQSAALEVRMAGYERQSTQTHYLAEYGVIGVMQQVPSNPMSATILGAAVAGAAGQHAACASVPCVNFSTCPLTVYAGSGCSEITTPISNPAKACYRWEGSGGVMQVPLDGTDGGVSGTPGSFGPTNMQGTISGEITDVAGAPMAMGNSAGNGLSTYSVAVTAYGQTSTTGSPTSQSQGTEQLRARIQVVTNTINFGTSCQ